VVVKKMKIIYSSIARCYRLFGKRHWSGWEFFRILRRGIWSFENVQRVSFRREEGKRNARVIWFANIWVIWIGCTLCVGDKQMFCTSFCFAGLFLSSTWQSRKNFHIYFC
jgi:hypothetical protein